MRYITIFFFTAVLLTAGFVFVSYRGTHAILSERVSTMNETATGPYLAATSSLQIPDGWRVYRNSRYAFSLSHPSTMNIQEFDEGGGTQTITFEDVVHAQGFQLFILPYTEAQVTEERFKQDIPSGVRKNTENIVIDGVVGAAFYSANDLLGETREVWFIHNGYLYEITTLKPLEKDLRDILTTWKFH